MNGLPLSRRMQVQALFSQWVQTKTFIMVILLYVYLFLGKFYGSSRLTYVSGVIRGQSGVHRRRKDVMQSIRASCLWGVFCYALFPKFQVRYKKRACRRVGTTCKQPRPVKRLPVSRPKNKQWGCNNKDVSGDCRLDGGKLPLFAKTEFQFRYHYFSTIFHFVKSFLNFLFIFFLKERGKRPIRTALLLFLFVLRLIFSSVMKLVRVQMRGWFAMEKRLIGCEPDVAQHLCYAHCGGVHCNLLVIKLRLFDC